MKILSTTICYPTPLKPSQGVFIRHRLQALARLAEVRVVCPIPYFPGYSATPPPDDTRVPLPVYYPTMRYIPGILKSLDARFFAASLGRAIAAIRAEFPFDLIDAHFVWPDGVGAATVAREIDIPIVVTVRGKLVSQVRYSLRKGLIVRMLREVNGRIAVSHSLARLVRETAGNELDVRVIPNGIDPETFRPIDPAAAKRTLQLPDGRRHIVSVGQIREIKGFDRLVEILPEIRRQIGDVHLILIGPTAGESTYERHLRQLIRRKRVENSVSLIGQQDQSTVARYLAAADVFALATRSEGWCNAIQESLAVGTPAVTTDVGGNRELISSNGIGLLVPFGRPDLLAQALVRALQTRWDRQMIAAVGGRRNWSVVANETMNYFDEVLSRRPPTGKQAS